MRHLVQYIAGLVVVLVLRVVPHPPNVEPIMATMMPYARAWGPLAGAFFTGMAIVGYDFATGTLGAWTYWTAGTYIALGVLAGLYFRNRPGTVGRFVGFAVVGTLVYDAVTGIGMSMLVFDQSLLPTVIGQIPFTVNHLIGNIVLSAVLAPALSRWIVENPELEAPQLLVRLRRAPSQ